MGLVEVVDFMLAMLLCIFLLGMVRLRCCKSSVAPLAVEYFGDKHLDRTSVGIAI